VNWVNVPVFGVTTGAAGAYSLTTDPAFTTPAEAYRVGAIFIIKANHASTGPSTLDVSGMGTKPIKVNVTGDTLAGTISLDEIITLVYDGINFQITAGGAISAEQIAPGIEGQMLRTRIVSAQPKTVWETSIYKTAVVDAVAIPAGGTPVEIPHGLGAQPFLKGMSIVCDSPDLGYPIGYEIGLETVTRYDHDLDNDDVPTVWASTTHIGTNGHPGSSEFRISHKNTGFVTSITAAKWKLIAWAMV
jgi:hypothetical protein